MESTRISSAGTGHLIRRFQPGDAAGTRAVFYEAVHVGAAAFYSPEERRDWAPSRDMSAEWGRWLDEHITFVGEREGAVTGFMMLERSGYLNMAFVAPHFRGTGLADRLHAAILTEARALDLPRLTVLASRMGVRFFARMGWKPAPELAESLGEGPTNHAMILDPVPA